MSFLDLFLLAITTEAVVEIITTSELFRPIRWMFLPTGYLCGYCLSVWIAFLFLLFSSQYTMLITYGFVIHRLSNIIHEAFNRWFKKKPIVGVVTVHLNNLNKDNDLTK